MGYSTNYSLNILSGDDYKTDYKEEISNFTDYISLFGEGEDSEDLWKAYFKNGKMQFCEAKIIYDEFNENELE